MVKEEQSSAPGAGVWIALMISALFILIFTFNLPSKSQREKQEIQNWLASHISKDIIQILVLGSSLTGCGLDSSSHLESNIYQQCHIKTQVIKIWKLDAGPVDFAELSPAINRTHPSIVVIEANTLFYSFTKKNKWPAYVQRFRDFAVNKHYAYEPDSKPYVMKRKMTELEAFRSGITNTSQLYNFAELLKRWNKNGTKIVLLNYPLESSLEIKKWNNSDTTSFYANLRYLKNYCSFEYIDPKFRWDETNFIDHAHLNTAGEQKQSHLFCELICKQLSSK